MYIVTWSIEIAGIEIFWLDRQVAFAKDFSIPKK